MRRILIALAATTAFAAGAPAAAQNYGGNNIQFRIDQLRLQLQAGVRSGEIRRSEAMPLREQLRQLAGLERRFSRDGLNGRERAELQHRISHLRQQIRFAGRDRRGNFERYDDRFDRDDRYQERGERRYDRDGDWDDRDGRQWDDSDGRRDGDDDDRFERGDRDGRDWRGDDDRFDRDYDEFGNPSVRAGLRVGNRASGNLGAVPYDYRGQFRDGNGTYFRSDGQRIYQIDARSHVIVRIFEMGR